MRCSHPIILFLAVWMGIAITGCSTLQAPPSAHVEIGWTRYDVPHIRANDYHSLGFGYGHVFARDRLCEAVGRAIAFRGERSRWYGADGRATVGFLKTTNLNSDLIYRLRLPEAWVQAEWGKLDTKTRDYVRGAVAGMNDYVANLSDTERSTACPGEPIPTFTVSDVVRAAMSIGVMRELVDIGPSVVSSSLALQESVPEYLEPSVHAWPVEVEGGFGSNGWVYGSDVVAGGGALMLGNPHSAWHRRPDQQRIYMHQVHLTIPGELDVAGASFSGIPMPLTGFNRDVAWTILHAGTVTTHVLQAMDVNLSDTPPTYLMDGVRKPLEIKPIVVDVLGDDGSTTPQTFAFAHSELGPLYQLPAARGRAAGWYAITNAGEHNARGLDQFLAVARATSTRGLIEAVEGHRGIISQLLIADRHGEVGYVIAGNVLPISDDAMRACHSGDPELAFHVIDGSRRACAFRRDDGSPKLASPAFYPTLVSRGIIHNTNNSYKYSEYGVAQRDYPTVFGHHVSDNDAGHQEAAGLRYDPRLAMSARRMGEVSDDDRVTPAEAAQVVFDNRNYAAETFLDAVLQHCSASDDNDVKTPCAVLAGWDRKNNPDSRGALLFHQFWNRVVQMKDLRLATSASDPQREVSLSITPSIASDMMAALAASVGELRSLGFAPDEPWGNALYARANGVRIPLHGGSYQEGLLNGEMPAPLSREGFPFIVFGTAYVQRVRWAGDGVIADVLLSHGQRDGVESEGRTAQLNMFSSKQLYRFPFSQADLSKAGYVDRLTLVPTADR